MKSLNIKTNNKSKLILLLSSLLFLNCSDYLDVDTDKDNPTNAPLNLLLTNIEVNLANTTDFNVYSGSALSTYTHQFTMRQEQDQYGLQVANIPMTNEWDNIYSTLTNIETLINSGSESGNLIYVGLAQIQKAYIMSIAVDLWGNIPYSEASSLQTGIINPKFDDQKIIYKQIMTLIETAKRNISSNAGDFKPSSDDLFYGGDTEKWIRFANSFKLKLYNQQRLISDFDQTGLNALIAENNFFTSMDDDFEFNQTKNIAPTDERNKLFLESYNSTQFSTNMSPWFYEILKGVNPNIHAGNPDPRMNYYFFNQLLPQELPVDQGDPETGNPKADYWDSSTGFFSIRFGSIGPWRDFSTESSYTYPGIFPCGGRYNDGVVYKNGSGSRITIDAQAGTGIAPHRMFTHAEFLYVQAELILSGKISGDAALKLEDALLASFAKVDQVVMRNNSSQNIPNLSSSSQTSIFIDTILSEFNSASVSKKLEIIMTQKWVATFGDPGDQYNDYRRTGFPILANPNSSSKEYQLDNNDDFPLIDSQTVLNKPYQQSLYWPQNELNANKNAPPQKVPATYKIFWAN